MKFIVYFILAEETKDELPYKILKESMLDSVIKAKTEQVAMDIGVSFELARALLLTNGWTRKEVIEAMASDPEYVKKTFKFDPEEAKATVAGNS